jgi:hypothetical protein
MQFAAGTKQKGRPNVEQRVDIFLFSCTDTYVLRHFKASIEAVPDARLRLKLCGALPPYNQFKHRNNISFYYIPPFLCGNTLELLCGWFAQNFAGIITVILAW